MNCQQINELIYDYCDNKINPETAMNIEKHLRECPFCRNNEKLTRMENEALHNLENSSVLLSGFTEKVMASIDKEYYSANIGSKGKLSIFSQIYKSIPKIAVVAVILLLITAGFVFNSSILKIGNNNRIADNSKQINRISNKEDEAGLSQIFDKTNKNPSYVNKDKSLNKTDLSSVNNEEITIHNEAEQTSVSKQETFSKSAESPRISSVQMRLEPVNIPSKYELTNIYDNKQNTTFCYTAINQSSNFTVTVSPELTEDTLKASSYTSEADNYQPALGNLSSPVSWKIKNNDHIYTITLNGNLSSEELHDIVNSIDFSEKPFANIK